MHEYGHYIVGRWCGIHAEVFSLGFGPVLFSRVDKHGTRWQFAALPFGGFVKFLGDADAASGKDGETISRLSDAERRRTMHGAPLWARAATVAAGPVFNFILTIAIYFAVIMSLGIATDRPMVGEPNPMPNNTQTLRKGDLILAVNGKATPDLAEFVSTARAVPPSASVDYTVERGGMTETIRGPYPFPAMIGSIALESAAQDAGLTEGDVILSVDGKPVNAFVDLVDIVKQTKDKPLLLKIWRDGAVFDATLVPRMTTTPTSDGSFEERYLIGLGEGLVFVPELYTPGPIETLELSVERTWTLVKTSLSGLGHIISGAISSCNLRGPLGIAKSSSAAASQGWLTFTMMIAALSTAVGLMNLFPIPVLDGGHLVFHAYEAVTGKPPSDMALRALMGAGLFLLLGLMVFALGNDLFC
ncbi:RIP metalloprotease RseP [Pseudorhodobacter sp.]|uniref:RIP metalloprotease RseP n=1 Tax=Pseudorhodobacter sp. TaxID=1934400 RepID=UPI00264A137E|nr:RIP metalloprotease RseP [Pseudorhodobacter sp.]MDN5786209.1 RIP metalloprotease RseP [Pseudorhodobacter sp.]